MDSFKETLNNIPPECGVYLMKDERGRIIYVGKSNNLRRRVRSYFRNSLADNLKKRMVSKVRSIDYIACGNEAEALILEAALVKESNPKYNINLKDDKTYPFLTVSIEEFPLVGISRKKGLSAHYFGPYTRAKSLKSALVAIRKIFPFRTCNKMPSRACLFHDLALCPAPCVGLISRQEYSRNIKSVIMLLEGKRKQLIRRLNSEMKKESKALRFEEAEEIKNKIESVCSLYSAENSMKQVVDLKEVLGLPKVPFLIEAVDISNLAGKERTGSVVVFRAGEPSAAEYRRYKINTRRKDDSSMLAEVVLRRFTRLKKERVSLPDLLVVDGGLPQVGGAVRALRALRVRKKVEVIGLAKRGGDKIWVFGHNQPIFLPGHSSALNLLRRLRDEAHRFARKYHILLRRKKMYG